jgi:transposase
MAKTLSQDLRSRVIAAVQGGMSRRAAAERYAIGEATAIRWLREFTHSGATAAKPKGGDRRSHRIEAYGAVLLGVIEAQVDISLVELAELLQRDHGLSVAPSTVWRFLKRHDITIKKNGARQRTGSAGRGRAPSSLVRQPAGS